MAGSPAVRQLTAYRGGGSPNDNVGWSAVAVDHDTLGAVNVLPHDVM